MVVQQNRKSPFTVLTAHNSTGNRSFMCNKVHFSKSIKCSQGYCVDISRIKTTLPLEKMIRCTLSSYFLRINLHISPCLTKKKGNGKITNIDKLCGLYMLSYTSVILWHIRSGLLILIFISVAFPQSHFANILYVKYADVILMMGINCLT